MPEQPKKYFALSVEDAANQLDTDLDRGLSTSAARERLEEYGQNRLRKARTRPAALVLLDQFKSIVIILMTSAAVLAFATAHIPEGIALVGVTVVNTLIGFFSEWKAQRSMAELRRKEETMARVRRDGEEQEVSAFDLVPGDIVLLEAELLVPADMRIAKTEELRVNEASLTGESAPISKRTDPVDEDAALGDRTSTAYKGTAVTDGAGEGLVTATGMHTELGRIAELAEEAEGAATPLQKRLDQLGRQLAFITIGIAALVAVAGLVAGRETVIMVETAIALGVAAIPEGLPIVATIALARGMWIMAERNALVNRLTAVETLGATHTIFSDKTGTLTENRMRLQRVVTPSGDYAIDLRDQDNPNVEGGAVGHDEDDAFERMLRVFALCENASLQRGDEGAKGDPMEIALLEAAQAFGAPREQLVDTYPEVREEPFNRETMKMATFHEREEGYWVAVKGAPDRILEVCTRQTTDHGDPAELTDDVRDQWTERVEAMARNGMRVLALADKTANDKSADPYGELCFLGLVGLLDPPRMEVKETVKRCKEAGMRVVMVTGDDPNTAHAVGEQVGIVTADSPPPIHGKELVDSQDLSDAGRKKIHETNIFARVSPEQKLNLVTIFQELGDTVAMTGDGINDAPALKKADIGVAMGKRGTEAARQVADMILQDDRLESIVEAVREGRIIFANIRKSVMFMLCTNIAEIIAVALASLVNAPLPLQPLQILYLNVLTDVFPALALGVGKGDPHVMEQPPRDAKESVLTRHHWTGIGSWAVCLAVCVLSALGVAYAYFDLDETTAVTVSFLTLAFGKLWFVFNLRDRAAGVLDNDVVKNPWVWASIGFCIVLLLLAVYWPLLAYYLDTSHPGAVGWGLILGFSLLPAIIGLIAPGIRFYAYQEHVNETGDTPTSDGTRG